MNLRPSIALYLLFFTVGFGSHSLPVSAQAPAAAQQLRDGQHDFDFHFGTWHTHIRLLVHPLTAPTLGLNRTVPLLSEKYGMGAPTWRSSKPATPPRPSKE